MVIDIKVKLKELNHQCSGLLALNVLSMFSFKDIFSNKRRNLFRHSIEHKYDIAHTPRLASDIRSSSNT